jgi:hypothetical protein
MTSAKIRPLKAVVLQEKEEKTVLIFQKELKRTYSSIIVKFWTFLQFMTLL